MDLLEELQSVVADQDRAISRLLRRIGDLEGGRPAPADALIDRALDRLETEILRKSQGNPHHKGKGEGGGQFTGAGGEGGGGGGAAGKGKPHGKHYAKRQRRKKRQKRKPGAARPKANATKAKAKAGAAETKTARPKAKTDREKTRPTRGKMVEARREGTGKDARIVMKDGSAPPDHIKANQIPPQWTDVKVSVDPKAEVLITARDAKGRTKMVTSESYDARSAAVKFGRVSEMIDKHDAIGKQIQAARGKPETKEEADASWLMQVQATRPGSHADTKARVKAYGATTLEARHVIESKDGVRLQFVGKEGIWHDHLVRDPDMAKMLIDRKNAAKTPEGPLFATSNTKVRDFVASLDGGKFSPKDFRTSAATRMARDAVKADPQRSRTEKEHTVRVKAVAERVSRLLGNKPAQALKSYIHPAVFESWKPS